MEFPLQDQVYFAQSAVICELADKGPCVIVGRCADSVLENYARIMKVFIYAPLEQRIQRAEKEYHVDTRDFKDYVKKTDKKRKGYYDYFTHRVWGKKENYHLCLDSSIGLDLAADLIARAAREFPQG